jgi:transcriptional regulator with XRE-family HTH domain
MNAGNHPADQNGLEQPSAEADGAAPPVGAQLRQRRFESGMSLRELARRLDVSPSLVSQIETGKVQPSVRTLYAIVSELGLSLDAIFELVGSTGHVVAEAPEQSSSTSAPTAPVPSRPVVSDEPRSDGGAIVHRANERRTIELEAGVRWERMMAWDEPDVEFMVTVYGVGGSSSGDGNLMRHSGREFGLVLSGTLNVTVGFGEHVLEPGDSISFQSTIPHRLRNDGDVEVRAVWVTLGRYGPE